MKVTDLINAHKNKLLNIAVIILALIVANNINKSQNKDIGSLQVKEDAEVKKNQVLASISDSEKRINFYRKMFHKKDMSSVINTISNIANGLDIKIISIRPDNEKSYPVYIEYPINLVISAKDYHSIGKFISKIESSSDIYLVGELNIEASSGSQAPEEGYAITARLGLNTLFMNE